MKIGITTYSLARKAEDELPAIKRFADAGFTALDYSLDIHDGADSLYLKDGWREYAEKLRAEADKYGLVFALVHAPLIYTSDNEENVARKIEITKRGFEVAKILGSPYMVVHPRMFTDGINGENAEKYLSFNVDFYNELLPYAEKANVKIALENMFGYDVKVRRLCRTTFSTMEEMLECKRRLNSDYITICLDTGHSNIHRESPALAAKKLGKNLECLHVHDNWGIDDNHLACGFGNIDWDSFVEALKEIGYNGVFSSEATSMGELVPDCAADAAMRLTAQISRELLERHGITVD